MKPAPVSRPSVWTRLKLFLASARFFHIVLAYLILSALYVALTSLYPMAFDENFHIGLIEVYSHLLNPFSVAQTPASDAFGAIETDPSYLYHYLMSFPYRLLMAVTDNQTATIIVLRLMNIAFFAWAIVIYRRLLLLAGLTPAVVHNVLAIFVLVPVVPLLAGQVNYDNVLMLLVAYGLLLAIRIQQTLAATRRLPLGQLAALLLLLLFGILVKYAFLPIAVAIVIYVAFVSWQTARKPGRKFGRQIVRDLGGLSRRSRYLIIGLAIIGLVLCGQRYGQNIVQYGDPVPDCAAVLNEDRCLAYGPWARDYKNSMNKAGLQTDGPIGYTVFDWFPGMWQRLFFSIAGPTVGYQTKKPLPLPSDSAIVIAGVGGLLAVVYLPGLIRRYPAISLFLLVSALYVAALWVQVYQLYLYAARPVAINGRYLLPLLPLLGVIMALGISRFMHQLRLARYSAGLVIVSIVLLSSGGVVTYIIRNEPSWLWSAPVVQETNQALKAVLKPLVIGD